MLPVLQAVGEAETRGDAAGALEIVETYPTGSDGGALPDPAGSACRALMADRDEAA